MQNFQRLRSGEPWKVTEPTARAIIESAEYWAQHRADPGAVEPPEYHFQGNVLEVRNDSGYAMPRFSVAAIGKALIPPAGNLLEFQNYPRFSVITPTANSLGNFCVTIEPIAAGGVGLAQFSGVVPCQVLCTAGQPAPAYVDIAAGKIGWLAPLRYGTANVMWCDVLTSSSPNYQPGTVSSSGSTPATGTPWAYVRIPDAGLVLPTELTLQPSSCVPSVNFSLSAPAGMAWGYSSGLDLNDAAIKLLTLTQYNDPSIKLLLPGLWDVMLDWTIGGYDGLPGASGAGQPYIIAAQCMATITQSAPTGGLPALAGVPIEQWHLAVPATDAVYSSTPILTGHRHWLLDVPSNTTLSVVASVSQQSGFSSSSWQSQIAAARLRLCNVGSSQLGYI